MNYSDMTIEQLQDERAKIEAEIMRRIVWNPTNGVYMPQCCGRIPCERTFCQQRGTIAV